MTAYLKKQMLEKDFIKNMLVVIGATTLIGVVWEFSEYIANQTLIDPFYRWFGITAYFMGDLEDTVFDLALDILGGSLFWIIHFFRSRNTHKAETEA